MPIDSVWIVIVVIAMFGALELAMAYVNMVASAKAITFEEEQARRGK